MFNVVASRSAQISTDRLYKGGDGRTQARQPGLAPAASLA